MIYVCMEPLYVNIFKVHLTWNPQPVYIQHAVGNLITNNYIYLIFWLLQLTWMNAWLNKTNDLCLNLSVVFQGLKTISSAVIMKYINFACIYSRGQWRVS